MRISDWSSDVCSSDLCRSTVLSSCDVNEKDGPSTSSGRTDRSIFSASPREPKPLRTLRSRRESYDVASLLFLTGRFKIGRASCRERVCQYVKISVVAESLKKKKYIISIPSPYI